MTAQMIGSPTDVRYIGQADEVMYKNWRIKLKLDMPGLSPAAAIWTIFDKDPIPDFKERVKRVKELFTQDIESTAGEEEISIMTNAQIRVTWNAVFREVTGDRVYLLSGLPGTAQSFSSDTKPGLKWIVTKVVFVEGKPVCWAVPVEVKSDTMVDVVFDKDSVIDLVTIFSDIIDKE